MGALHLIQEILLRVKGIHLCIKAGQFAQRILPLAQQLVAARDWER